MVKMKKTKWQVLILIMLSALFLIVSFNRPSALKAEKPVSVILKAGTPINLRLTEEVSPKTKNVSDVIHFEVVGDIKVDNNIVIKANAPAEGEITVLEKAAMLGKPDKLAFIVRLAYAVDGTRVPLRATLTREGKDEQTSSLALGVFLCPLCLFQQGGKAEFPTGTEVRAYVDYDTTINITNTVQ